MDIKVGHDHTIQEDHMLFPMTDVNKTIVCVDNSNTSALTKWTMQDVLANLHKKRWHNVW